MAFSLNVPFLSNPDLSIPFGWFHDPTSTLDQSLQRSLTEWEAETKIDIRYLSDGVNGEKGQAVLTDLSLAGGLDVMNVFNVTAQGDGAITNEP